MRRSVFREFVNLLLNILEPGFADEYQTLVDETYLLDSLAGKRLRTAGRKTVERGGS